MNDSTKIELSLTIPATDGTEDQYATSGFNLTEPNRRRFSIKMPQSLSRVGGRPARKLVITIERVL